MGAKKLDLKCSYGLTRLEDCVLNKLWGFWISLLGRLPSCAWTFRGRETVGGGLSWCHQSRARRRRPSDTAEAKDHITTTHTLACESNLTSNLPTFNLESMTNLLCDKYCHALQRSEDGIPLRHLSLIWKMLNLNETWRDTGSTRKPFWIVYCSTFPNSRTCQSILVLVVE